MDRSSETRMNTIIIGLLILGLILLIVAGINYGWRLFAIGIYSV